MKALLVILLLLSGCTIEHAGRRPVFTFVHELSPTARTQILDTAAAGEKAAADVIFYPK